MNDSIIEKVVNELESYGEFAIICHSHPDGDTIGSAFALKYAYPDKDVAVICEDEIPERIAFISDGSQTDIPEKKYEKIVSVDCATTFLMGEKTEAKYKYKTDIKIDHHRTGEDYAEFNCVDAEASAVGEIIYKILKKANRLNKKSCEALYAAIASDCGCFMYANTTKETHIIASELIEQGINFKKINTLLFESKTKTEISALKLALNGLEYYLDSRLAIITFTNKIKTENGIVEDDLGAIPSLTREIKGVELGVVIKELDGEDGVYKISTRSSDKINCCEVCALFGGGGHIRASGATVRGKTPDEIKKIIIDYARENLSDE